ncbi:50S ribosomal protein L10 [Naumannella halotolerans]|uniref:50S ribosomal protein L10 n=1 Tax=Naumannella halotolerans TaxID=993414 RepID=UPI00370D1BCB
MARPDKVATVKELSARFSDSDAVVLTEYRGLSVSALKELRRSLGDEATYAVTKNTLTQRAAKDAGIDGLDDKLVGPTAVAFINGDVATVAKGLRDFAKANPLLVLKGGVMDGRVLGAEDVTKLADLESREVLLAKLAGAMKASMSNAAALFAAPLTEAVRTFAALQAAAEENPELIGGAGTPAAEAPAAQEQQDSPAAAEEPAAE